MAKYTLKGGRYLRRYTEENPSPTYATTVQVEQIVSSLCTLDWEKVTVANAQMSYHTNDVVMKLEDGTEITGLDMNVRIRDSFDAAMFCAEHAGGSHRAYANVAVYKYRMPDDAIGKTLESVKMSVVSDPYNKDGVRLHLFTNSTGTIPTSCSEVRGNSSLATSVTEDSDGITANGVAVSGVVKRIEKTIDGSVRLYPNNKYVTLEPSDGLTLGKYLFLLVALENYGHVNGSWIDSCAFIKNNIEIELDEEVASWSESELNDCVDSGVKDVVAVKDGIKPKILKGYSTGIRRISVRPDANLVVEENGSQTTITTATDAQTASAIMRLYKQFLYGAIEFETSDTDCDSGAKFTISRKKEQVVTAECDRLSEINVIELVSSICIIPCVFPRGAKEVKFTFTYSSLSVPDGVVYHVYLVDNYNTEIGDEFKTIGLYLGSASGFDYLGSIKGGTKTIFSANIAGKTLSSLVIVPYMGMEYYNLLGADVQGTGSTAFVPDVKIG